MSESLGIWLVRVQGEALVSALQARLGGEVYRPWLNTLAQKAQFAAAYRLHTQWIMLAASGIAVRFLEGLVQDKHSDPAVVVLDEAGRFAISLLAGHEGGGNLYSGLALSGLTPGRLLARKLASYPTP